MANWAMAHSRLVSVSALLLGLQASADKFDAGATKKIFLDKTWAVEEFDGPGHFYWTRNSNGTLCLRLHDGTGNCDDTGHWIMQDGCICV